MGAPGVPIAEAGWPTGPCCTVGCVMGAKDVLVEDVDGGALVNGGALVRGRVGAIELLWQRLRSGWIAGKWSVQCLCAWCAIDVGGGDLDYRISIAAAGQRGLPRDKRTYTSVNVIVCACARRRAAKRDRRRRNMVWNGVGT